MIHYDGHHNRIDRIVRPQEILTMEKEIFGRGLFTSSPWKLFLDYLLIQQNGETSITCPMVCTEGAIKIMEKYAADNSPEVTEILRHMRDGIDGEFAIGAQYLSEIQGGSDVPANVFEAVNEDGTWRLYGWKFFCSATHADYALVTAKPQGSETVALFIVPSWLPGNKEKEIRNGYTIDRIKWKMGTCELTTAELHFDGAVAYPIGPLDKGISNVVGTVLTRSRLSLANGAASFLRRAAREAELYAKFRDAFGVKIDQFPAVFAQLQDIRKAADRTTAGCFKLYRDFLNQDNMDKKKKFMVRELIMFQKITAAWDSTDYLRLAMSIFGGHGVMEDFTILPRLYRDSAVNEYWEGPRNVLLAQIYHDFQRAASWYSPQEFIQDALEGADPAIIADFAARFEEVIAYPDLEKMDEKTIELNRQWDQFAGDFYHVYQDIALAEIEKVS